MPVNRRWVAGSSLLVLGAGGLYGSISGTLAAMLAALFDPKDLIPNPVLTKSNPSLGATIIQGLESSPLKDIISGL